MPGHKRRAAHSPLLPWQLDITEIDGFDDLHAPDGILRDAQMRAARLWGSDEAYFLINGSSGGILAGVYASVSPGDRILLARNCHKSVYHAVELMGLHPVYLEPAIVAGAGIAGSVTAEAVARALEAYPDIRLVVLTSPTYEGVLSDVGAIAAVLHNRDIPLFVDEAHGAHLGLSSHFPPSAVHQGADLVVQSLHKTLPSLTQTAVLHRAGERVSPARLRHALGVFQSTSPSYPLLASMDGCVTYLEEQGEGLFDAWRQRLDRFYEEMRDLRHLKLLRRELDSHHIYTHDPGKLVILCGGTSLTGTALMDALRAEFGIELEMALDGYAIAMTSPQSTDGECARLGEALRRQDSIAEAVPERGSVALPSMPEQMMLAGEAMRLPGRQVGFAESVGQIARGYVWAYPPGVPLVTPGVRITTEIAVCLSELEASGVVLKRTFEAPEGQIEIVDNR
ncbi:MAG: aminotransferase class I/II-fold pyridoxal phosphate-dependent enzyme [Oscillospiraceae bacterium]|nr:aminotransferase class I/II-fold pyridoxal phosphate-dependent enzyme [Oscillospiraceae bacterium]